MVEAIEYFGLDHGAEGPEVDDITGRGVDGAGNTNGQFVVVSVEVDAIALSVQPRVLCIAQRRIVNSVRGVEVFVTNDGNTISHAWATLLEDSHPATRVSGHPGFDVGNRCGGRHCEDPAVVIVVNTFDDGAHDVCDGIGGQDR